MIFSESLRRVVIWVAILNLGNFGIEFSVATAIGSVSLFADSVDFLEDASVNLLIAIALNWTPRSRARVGMALALILLAPGLATLWTAWSKLNFPVAPAPTALSLTGLGALAVNLFCAFLLARYRGKSHASRISFCPQRCVRERRDYRDRRRDRIHMAIRLAGLDRGARHRRHEYRRCSRSMGCCN